MNAAYLLIATAWLAGADAAPAASAPAVHAAAPCNTCNTCADDCGGAKWSDRLRGLFRKRNDDCCEPCAPTCAPAVKCAPVTCCTPAPACDSCDDCGGGGLFGRLKGMFSRKNDCNECEDSCRPSLFDRIRARFSKNNDCCDTCNTCGTTHSAPAAPAGGAEPIAPPKETPKKLPTGEPGTVGNISTSLQISPARVR